MQKKLFLIIFTFAFMQFPSTKAMAEIRAKNARQKQLNDKLKQYILLNDKEKVEKYLKAGARPNLVTYSYLGPYDCCHNEVYTWYALIDLIHKRNEDLACLFLNHGADPNTKNRREGHNCCLGCFRKCYYLHEEEPALILAAEHNLTRVCTLLLEKGANAHEEYDGKNALTWAEKNENRELIALLRDTYKVKSIPQISQKKKSCADQCSVQ